MSRASPTWCWGRPTPARPRCSRRSRVRGVGSGSSATRPLIDSVFLTHQTPSLIQSPFSRRRPAPRPLQRDPRRLNHLQRRPRRLGPLQPGRGGLLRGPAGYQRALALGPRDVGIRRLLRGPEGDRGGAFVAGPTVSFRLWSWEVDRGFTYGHQHQHHRRAKHRTTRSGSGRSTCPRRSRATC